MRESQDDDYCEVQAVKSLLTCSLSRRYYLNKYQFTRDNNIRDIPIAPWNNVNKTLTFNQFSGTKVHELLKKKKEMEIVGRKRFQTAKANSKSKIEERAFLRSKKIVDLSQQLYQEHLRLRKAFLNKKSFSKYGSINLTDVVPSSY